MKPFKDKASSSTSSNENTVDVDADLHPAKKQRLDDKRVSNLGKTIQENNQANSPTKSPQPNSAKKLSRSERKKLKKVNKGNMVNNNQGHSSSQSSNKPPPVEFDYSKVDFKKFQGGSQKSQQQQLDIKSKFIGKVRIIWSNDSKITMKHKLLTYSLFYFRERITKQINNSINYFHSAIHTKRSEQWQFGNYFCSSILFLY